MNAVTAEEHTEPDCAYTMIAIPILNKHFGIMERHYLQSKRKSNREYMFEFHCNANKIVTIMLEAGTIIYYAAHAITHRQQSRRFEVNENNNNNWVPSFWNLATYGNKKLYTHTVKSIKRMMGINDR